MTRTGTGRATGGSTVDWRAAAQALGEQVDRVTALLRTVDEPDVRAMGEWTLAEVAMHLSQAWLVVPAMAADDLRPTASIVPTMADGKGLKDVWELAEVTTSAVRTDPERDLKVIADRIDQSAGDFLGTLDQQDLSKEHAWLVEGVRFRLPNLICHLLNETTVHGYDMAKAAGRRWPIPKAHAAFILDGLLMPVVTRLGPSVVDQKAAAGRKVTYDIRIRGGGRYLFAFDNGDLVVEQPGSRPVDCHVSADPRAMLLVVWARQSQWSAIARGGLLAWGRKPWQGLRLRSLLRNP